MEVMRFGNGTDHYLYYYVAADATEEGEPAGIMSSWAQFW